MKFNNDEELQHYLSERTKDFNARSEVSIATASKPIIEPHEMIFPIPFDVWGNEQYGSIASLIEYIRDVNKIPFNAFVEVSIDDRTQLFKVRFTWWNLAYLA